MRKLVLTAILAASSAWAGPVCPAPGTPAPTQEQVSAILDTVQNDTDLLEREKQYYTLVQSQLLKDAILLYSSRAPKIVYAEFSQDKPGQDFGYGLHVVKRLDLGEKTIFVNEAWPYQEGRLQLPSEIRIRTRLFYKPGAPRGASGAEREYLNGRYRIGWDQDDQPHFFEEPGYLDSTRSAQRRTGANIYNCTMCHVSGNPLAGQFSNGAPISFESIVQNAYFATPVQKTLGYTGLISYLQSQKLPSNQLSWMQSALAKPVQSFHSVPYAGSMASALCEKLSTQSFDWLEPDAPFTGELSALQPSERHDGIYQDGGSLFRDSVDEILESRFGKYFRWLYNRGSVPGPQ